MRSTALYGSNERSAFVFYLNSSPHLVSAGPGGIWIESGPITRRGSTIQFQNDRGMKPKVKGPLLNVPSDIPLSAEVNESLEKRIKDSVGIDITDWTFKGGGYYVPARFLNGMPVELPPGFSILHLHEGRYGFSEERAYAGEHHVDADRAQEEARYA